LKLVEINNTPSSLVQCCAKLVKNFSSILTFNSLLMILPSFAKRGLKPLSTHYRVLDLINQRLIGLEAFRLFVKGFVPPLYLKLTEFCPQVDFHIFNAVIIPSGELMAAVF